MHETLALLFSINASYNPCVVPSTHSGENTRAILTSPTRTASSSRTRTRTHTCTNRLHPALPATLPNLNKSTVPLSELAANRLPTRLKFIDQIRTSLVPLRN